jgi:hypothetical protein
MDSFKRLVCFTIVALFIFFTSSFAIDDGKVPDDVEIMGWIDKFCEPDNRRPGEPGDLAGEDFIAKKFREFGLADVKKEPVDITIWRAKDWSLTVGGEEIPSFYCLNTGFTPKDGITAEMVYMGSGTKEDFDLLDVNGKICVIDMEFATLPVFPLLLLKGYYSYDPKNTFEWWWAQPAIWVRKNWNVDADLEKSSYEYARKNGALAVVWILADQPTNINSHYGPYDGVMKELPALYVGKYDGQHLRELLGARSATATLVQTGTKSPGVMHNVHGILPGMSDEIILVTSHHDSPFKGYVEDGTGMGMVLSVAKYFSQIPREDREKTIVFLASAGHFYGSKGIETWLEKHKDDIVPKAVLNLNIEHVAAKEFIEGEDKNFVDTTEPQLAGIFIDNNDNMKDAIKEAIVGNDLDRSAIIAIDALGKDPPGEGRFPHRLGIPVIHYISGPAYLLVDEDNRDKVSIEKLGPSARTFIEIIERLARMSREDLLPKEEE